MKIITYENSITLYWEKEWDLSDGIEYRIYLNDRLIGKTIKTHYTLQNLQSETIYSIKVERFGEILAKQEVKTKKTKRKIDVSKAPYFAIGDGKTVNTAKIQKAIDDCKENEAVYIPEGIFMTGALKLHSNMELFVAPKAVLQGTANADDYLPKMRSRFEGIERECYKPLLSLGELDHTKGCSWGNVVIRGGGSILGGGFALYEAIVEQERNYLLTSDSTYAEREAQMSWKNTEPGRARGRLFQINNSENIVIDNLTLGNGPAWNVHFIYCENITVSNCKIISDGIPNGDGIDPDSCNNFTVFNCTFETGDDAIAVKSGKNPQGNIINRPCMNVQIFDCRGRKGIALGSEMSGGLENIKIWDCEFVCSRTGLRFRATRKRGGYIKNVKVRNCKFIDLHILAAMEMNNDGEGAGVLPVIKDIEIENLELTGMTRKHDGSGFEPIEVLRLRGNEEKEYYLQNIKIRDLKIHRRSDGQLQQFEFENFKDVTIENFQFI